MKKYKTGQYLEFFWIEHNRVNFQLTDLLDNHAGILENKYLAIICFDSGPLKLVKEETDQGWYEKNEIAYSPLLTQNFISLLPCDQYDQWCLFDKPTEFPGMTGFVNYSGFSLDNNISGHSELHTSNKEELEKQIANHNQLLLQFWEEISEINPVNFIANGDNFIFVSKISKEIEALKSSLTSEI